MGPASRKLGGGQPAGGRAGRRRAERASAGRGRREGGTAGGWGAANRTPSTHARAHPRAHNPPPGDGLASPQPSRARGRTARPVPGSRDGVGGHARAAGLRATGGSEAGTALPAPAGWPRSSGSEREADHGARPREQSRPCGRSARAPLRSRAGAQPRPGPEPRRRARAQEWRTPLDGQREGDQRRPARPPHPRRGTGTGDEGPGPGPTPRPRGRASDRPRPRPTSDTHIARTPARDGPPGRARAHTRAEQGNTTRGEDGPPRRCRQRPRHTPRGGGPQQAREARRPTRWGRVDPMRKSGPGEDETPGEAGGQAGRGRAPRDTSSTANRRQDARGGLTASSLRAQRRPRVAPAAADQAFSDPRGSPTAAPVARGQSAPRTHLPPHAPQGRSKPSGHPPGPHAGRRRPGPEGAHHGDADAGPSSGRRRRPHKAEPGSGPDGAANSVKAGEPPGKRGSTGGGRGGKGHKAGREPGGHGDKGTGNPQRGLLGRKPQARPGHQGNTATGSHRHRHEGGPAAPRLGRRTALQQATEQPLTSSPGPATRGPEATSATSPTPGATHRSFLVCPRRAPAPGDRRPPGGDAHFPQGTRRPNPGATHTRSSAPAAARHGSGRRAGSQRNAARTHRSRQPPSR